LEKIKFI